MKIEEMSLEYANKQLKDAGVTDSNCPRELAIAQASMMVNGYNAGAMAVLEEIETLITVGKPWWFVVENIIDKIEELKGEEV